MTAPTPVLLALLATIAPLGAQTAQPDHLKTLVSAGQQRVALLRDEVKQTDARIEARLDAILETLTNTSDSKNSGTKVTRMKEDTAKRLGKTITIYDQKRAALREEMRNPRLRLTAEEKQKLIGIFDARIEKRTQQILALHKSMPSHQEHERYRKSDGGWWGPEYERNDDYDQNRRLTSKSNSQRAAIIKQLEASIERLDRQSRRLKAEVAAARLPEQQKALSAELAKTEALIAERRQQRLDTLKPSSTATHTIALKEAMDLDKALQTAIADLRSDFNTLFIRYHALLSEVSALHVNEAALAKAHAR